MPQESLPRIGRYVALGSSMAAGPGIRPRAAGSPWRAMRSAGNYPHVIARRTGAELIDVTYSGATTSHLLTDSQNGAPPQIQALDGTEDLVTVTIGGNDVGYVPMLVAATLPSALRALPDDTMVYCGHEYTLANARFALFIDPDNEALRARTEEARAQRDAGQPTIPFNLGDDKKANPFLRADVADLACDIGMAGKPANEVFAEIRTRKNNF